MKSIHIRDVPDPVLERLKRRASLHHRSLQGELHRLLEEAARMPFPEEGDAGLTLKTVRTRGAKNWSRVAIYED